MTATPGLRFAITFHGPFHVGSGGPMAGLDRTLDRRVPLPGSSLKGLLRAEAVERLSVRRALVSAIFGSPGGSPSPWWFSDADLGCFEVERIARIKIEDRTGTTDHGFLLLGEQLWAESATFTVERTSDIVDGDMHAVVLRASARSVSSLGGDRRRAQGWVTIADDQPWTAQDTRLLRTAMGQ